jgi:uncharacterized protein (TIGR03089 family)
VATLPELFSRIVSSNPSSPFVTYYNDAPGERAELSAKSLGNWVAKIHFLMMDSLGLGPGSTARIALEPDWIAVATALGCWSAGLTIVEGAADVCITDVARAESTDADEVFCVDQTKLSRSCGSAPGIQDFVTAVRPQPDVWATVRSQASDIDLCIGTLPHSAVVTQATKRAETEQIPRNARLLFKATSSDWLDNLALILAVGGSMVLMSNTDADRTSTIATQENADVSR